MQPDVISYAVHVGSMQSRGVALVWRRYGRPTQSSWRDPIGEMHVLMADWLERFIPQGDKEAQLRRQLQGQNASHKQDEDQPKISVFQSHSIVYLGAVPPYSVCGLLTPSRDARLGRPIANEW